MISAPPGELRNAVITAYRSTIQERYEVGFIRSLPELEDKAALLSDELIARIRDFFLTHLYPPPAERDELDAAFDRMKDVLTSPRKMWSLIGTGARSLFKLGGMIPQAVSAGLKTLEAVRDIRLLEKELVDAAREKNLGAEALQDRQTFRSIVAQIPQNHVERFTGEMNKLFDHLANIKLLDTTIEILGDSRACMLERKDLFTSDEVSGLEHGLALMQGGVELYRPLTPEQIRALQSGVTAVELGWYAGVRREFPAAGGRG